MKPFSRVVVMGDVDFSDQRLVESTLDRLIYATCRRSEAEIVGGPYSLRWAQKRGYQASRPEQSAAEDYLRDNPGKATHLIAFWDGQDVRTERTIEYARDAGLKVKIIRYA